MRQGVLLKRACLFVPGRPTGFRPSIDARPAGRFTALEHQPIMRLRRVGRPWADFSPAPPKEPEERAERDADTTHKQPLPGVPAEV